MANSAVFLSADSSKPLSIACLFVQKVLGKPSGSYTTRVNMAHIRQSRPDFVLGFQVEVH